MSISILINVITHIKTLVKISVITLTVRIEWSGSGDKGAYLPVEILTRIKTSVFISI